MLRCLVLAGALLSYGAIPSTTFVQSEVEAQLGEFAAESSQCELRVRLRGDAIRRGESATIFSTLSADPGKAMLRLIMCELGERVSLGLALPLRC